MPKKTKTKPKKPYMSAKQRGITDVERKALIDFVNAPTLGQNIALNGHAHHYNQSVVDEKEQAHRNHCGTSGCVAGYVFTHAKIVQKAKKLRGAQDAKGYIHAAVNGSIHGWVPNPEYNSVLEDLYTEGSLWKVTTTQKVVDHMLRTGKVRWPSKGPDGYSSMEKTEGAIVLKHIQA